VSRTPFTFVHRRPEGPLGALVESIWFARGRVPYARERVAPTGSTVAVFVLGDPIRETPRNGRGEPLTTDRGFLLGPHDSPVINAPLGETFAVGIVSTPVGGEAIFGVPPKRLRGRVVDLLDAWPPATALRTALARLARPDGSPAEAEAMAHAMLDRIEHGMIDARPLPGTARCSRAMGWLEADPTRPIAEIAATLGISHGHLDREFTRIVGLTPRMLARLLRMRRLLAAIDVHQHVPWADLSARFGWFDQSHFIRDFKRHTGVSPSRYVAIQQATFARMEASESVGFVPEY